MATTQTATADNLEAKLASQTPENTQEDPGGSSKELAPDEAQLVKVLEGAGPDSLPEVFRNQLDATIKEENAKNEALRASVKAGEAPEAQQAVDTTTATFASQREAMKAKADALAGKVLAAETPAVQVPTAAEVKQGVETLRNDAIAGLKKPELMSMETVTYLLHDDEFKQQVLQEIQRRIVTHAAVPAEAAQYAALARTVENPLDLLRSVREGKAKLLEATANKTGDRAKQLQEQINQLEMAGKELGEEDLKGEANMVATKAAGPEQPIPDLPLPAVEVPASPASPEPQPASVPEPTLEELYPNVIPPLDVVTPAATVEVPKPILPTPEPAPPTATPDAPPTTPDAPKTAEVPAEVKRWQEEKAACEDNQANVRNAIQMLDASKAASPEAFAKQLAMYQAYDVLAGTEIKLATNREQIAAMEAQETKLQQRAKELQPLIEAKQAELNEALKDARNATDGVTDQLQNELTALQNESTTVTKSLKTITESLIKLREELVKVDVEKAQAEAAYAEKQEALDAHQEPVPEEIPPPEQESALWAGTKEGTVATAAGVGLGVGTAARLTGEMGVGALSKGSRLFFWLSGKLGTGGMQNSLMSWIGSKVTGLNEEQRQKYEEGKRRRAGNEGGGMETAKKLTEAEQQKKMQELAVKLGMTYTELTAQAEIDEEGKITASADFDASERDLGEFPKGLNEVKGDLDLSKNANLDELKHLPEVIGGDLILTGCTAKKIPEELKIGGRVILDASQTELKKSVRDRGYAFSMAGGVAGPPTAAT